MKLSHILWVLLVVAIWGLNFVVVKVGLRGIPPFLLGGLRFTFTALPWIFVIKRPRVPWMKIALYGLVQFAMQFGFLFCGMKLGMSAGLTSLVFQVQVFSTIGLSVLVFKEKVKWIQIVGALIAALGIAVIGFNIGGSMTPMGLILVLLGAVAWSFGNTIAKTIGKTNMIALTVWGSLFAPIPLFILSYFLDGPAAISESFQNMSGLSIVAVAYIVYPTTLLGFSVWSWLLNIYPASTVVPFTLLVPIFGMASSMLLLDESMESWKLIAGLLVIGGVSLSVLGAKAFASAKQMRQKFFGVPQ